MDEIIALVVIITIPMVDLYQVVVGVEGVDGVDGICMMVIVILVEEGVIIMEEGNRLIGIIVIMVVGEEEVEEVEVEGVVSVVIPSEVGVPVELPIIHITHIPVDPLEVEDIMIIQEEVGGDTIGEAEGEDLSGEVEAQVGEDPLLLQDISNPTITQITTIIISPIIITVEDCPMMMLILQFPTPTTTTTTVVVVTT